MGLEAQPLSMSSKGGADCPAASPEFNLAVGCCRYAFNRHDPAPVIVPARVDWLRFLELVSFHRVEGLAWQAASSAGLPVPDGVMDSLGQAASTIAASNLMATAECRRLRDLFAAADIPLLFLKGLTVGKLAYGKPSIKAAIDIDILIDGRRLDGAAGVLRQAGYTLLVPGKSRSDRSLVSWHRDWKESVWSNSDRSLQLDLHSACTDNRALLPGIDVHSPSQEVGIGGGLSLATLGRDELIAYLAVHGASSAWFRLKWISDFAALVHDRRADDVERLFARAQELGAGRAIGQALLVADMLFETLAGSSALRERLQRDPITRHLAHLAMRLLTRNPLEPTARLLGTLPIHYSQFLLLPGAGYKLSELFGQLRRISWRMRI
jgi:hypothetical protein